MHRDQVIRLIDQARAVTPATRDRAAIAASLSSTSQIRAICDAQDLISTRALEAMGVPAEVVFAQATRSNSRDAERVVQRANTAHAAPEFGHALADGKVAAEHIDQLTLSLRRIKPSQRTTLLADSPRLLAIAAQSTPDEFGRALRAQERRLATDDGMARFEQQRASVRLKTRTDLDTGMNVFTLTVDPVTGVMLHNKIQAATEALFHDKTPELCPTDPVEKQAFLRAHALLDIIKGKGIRLGRPEIVVVVDTTASDPATGAPTVDWGLPVEIPDRVLFELFEEADVHVVVVRNGVVLHAPGELNLRRSTRLANRAQRRALRAVYCTCAIAGCAAKFDNCNIHHLRWWEEDGPTDLDNLLPLCSKHHHLVHDGGWALHLAPDRILTVTLPDGTTMSTGPPKRNAA